MQAFVTGSTGLLGSNLVRLLLAQGHSVRALARSPQKAQKVLGNHERLELVSGDMEDIPAFAAALDGTEVLFHAAAYFREYFGPGDHWGKLKVINVDATLALLDEAQRRGLRRAIYVSSSGVLGGMPNNAPADENSGHDALTLRNLYFKSKVEGERAIAEWLRTHTLPVVLILPTAILGPSDTAPTNMGQAIVDLLDRKLPAIPPGGFEFVDARDVAQGMLNAVERGKSGERYILSAGYHSMAELAQTVARVSGVPAPRVRLPYAAALAAAYMSEFGARLRGTAPQIPVAAIRSMNLYRPVTAAKAQRELGVTFRPFAETLRDAVAWFRDNGYTSSSQAAPTGKSARQQAG